MFVQADWLAGQTEDDVFARMSAAWAVKSTFEHALRKRLQGQSIQFLSGDDLLIIGGRTSIEDAFSQGTAQNWQFFPAQGQILSVTARRKTHDKAKMLFLLPEIGMSMVTNEASRSPLVVDRIGKLLTVTQKKYTVVHIVSGPAGNYTVPPGTSGATMALELRNYFAGHM